MSLPRHAGRISGADQGADRGAGDGGRLHPHLVERLDDGDMRKPARAAAAEREREASSCAARRIALRANSQPVAASGRTSSALAAA